ncbi:polyprenyl synthetase family protein [Entomobacter blattae]|uniref:Farnesyl diphosphate synthase n=1 Tax=Entomobacter blattae TaxID=2762277 RepID=A0A7H1NUU2_9PROT|nr:farnesyl diphosphate synthase [Entomobacter blattae]QNT79552.1 Farnesyl diphosphate synthase [Entomobacter blattae]
MNKISTEETVTLKQSLTQCAHKLEETLNTLLASGNRPEERLIDAMRYGVLGGGKRLRGYMVMESAKICGVRNIEQALRVASSVEMLHAYSLIHDDLPAMDNDDLRRGQPSTHKKFDEATAILAGDALQTMAFQILAEEETHPSAAVRVELVKMLALASGAHGMVGGQMIDMLGEGKNLSLPDIKNLHSLKTGKLIRFATEAGAILGETNKDIRGRFVAYGRDIGMAFQIADDILDTTASEEELGKTAGKDAHARKSTFVSLLGIEGAKQEAQRLAAEAAKHVSAFGEQARFLVDLTHFVVERRN